MAPCTPLAYEFSVPRKPLASRGYPLNQPPAEMTGLVRAVASFWAKRKSALSRRAIIAAMHPHQFPACAERRDETGKAPQELERANLSAQFIPFHLLCLRQHDRPRYSEKAGKRPESKPFNKQFARFRSIATSQLGQLAATALPFQEISNAIRFFSEHGFHASPNCKAYESCSRMLPGKRILYFPSRIDD